MTIKAKKKALIDNLPSTVIIFGKQFDVQVTRLKDLYGDFSESKRLIRIHQELDIEAARETLFHEALHAAFAISGQRELLDEKHEEGLVRMLEHAFYHMLDINKLTGPIDKV